MGVRLSVSTRGGGAEEDAVYELEQARILIGRGAGADVSLPHRSVSARHATIEQQRGRYVIVDHGATNGTRVNGQKLVPERSKPLRDGDRIDVGTFVLTWKEGVAVARPLTAERTASLARRLLRDLLGDAAPSGARLVIGNGPQAGQELAIPAPPARLVIGRGETCDLVLHDADASREHVDLIVDLDGVIARDRGSKNGLVVGDRKLPEKRLADRDELQIGGTVIVFEDLESLAIRETEQSADEPLAPPEPEPPPPPAPAEDPDAPTGEPDPPPRASATTHAPATTTTGTPPSRRISSGELVVYVLAALVFAASIAGLALLLTAE